MNANVYTNTVEEVIEMFADATTQESTTHNRLITLELESGNTGLIGYGEKILAEYDESEGRITVYKGHEIGGGETVDRWINTVVDEAGDRRSVTFDDDAPWFRPPNADAAQYIGQYINFSGKDSSVEKDARDEVIDSLKFLDKFL